MTVVRKRDSPCQLLGRLVSCWGGVMVIGRSKRA